MVEMVRNFSYQNTMSIQGIHRSYTDQLAAERSTNLELRQQQFEMHAGMRRVAALLREGIRWTEDSEDDDLVRSVMNAANAAVGGTNIATGTNTLRRQVNSLHELSVLAELRHENRSLRRIIGLPASDSDDEEDNDDSSGAVGEAGSMQSSVPPPRAAGPRHDEGALIDSAPQPPQPPQQLVAEPVSVTASVDPGTSNSNSNSSGEATTPGSAANSGTNDARATDSGSARTSSTDASTDASTDTQASSDAEPSTTTAGGDRGGGSGGSGVQNDATR